MAAPPPVPVGRGREWDLLERHLERVRSGAASVLLVAGPHGSGSSTLARAYARHHAGRGGTVLESTAATWETPVAHGVLRQLLARLPGPPATSTTSTTRTASTSLESDVLEVAQDLAGRLGPLATGPVVVLVDEAHWSDPESLQVLSTLVRHHPTLPVLVLLAASTDVRPRTCATSRVLERVADRCELPPLSGEAVRRLAVAAGVDLDLWTATRLAELTAGLPGPVEALLREVPSQVWADPDASWPAPAARSAEVAEGLAGLDGSGVPGARALVEVVAVVGPGPVAVAARVAQVDEPLAAVDAAVEAGLLTVQVRRGETEVAPADPMTRAALLAALGRVRSAELHLRAAAEVADPAKALLHRAAAVVLPDSDLADALDAEARHRAGRGQWGDVADLLTAAARLTDDGVVKEDRAARAFDALVGAGETALAASRARELESLRETPLRNAALGYLAVHRGRPAEAETRLARAWDLVNVDRDPATAALVAQRWVLHHLARYRATDLVTWADRALALADPGSPVAVEAAAIRSLGVAGTGDVAGAREEQQRLAQHVALGAQGQRLALARGWLRLSLDEVEEARSDLASATSTDFLGGSSRIALWAHAWLARAHFAVGDWDEALRTARRGSLGAERTGTRLLTPLLAWTRVQVHGLRGEWEEAERAVRDADSGPQDYEMMRVASCLARAGLAEARADYAGVLRAVAPLRERWARGSIDEPGAWPWTDVCAHALVVEGRLEEADEFLRPHEVLAESRGHRSHGARLATARGRLLGARGDLDGARAAFERAESTLVELPLPYDRARLHFAWGQTLRRAGRRGEADDRVRVARELYDALGARAYVQRCDRELRAGGVRNGARAERTTAPEALTPQEELVAELVSRGMSNKEVASELFISAKTVQYHLTRVYAKIGVRTRGELSARRAGAPQSSR